MEEGGFLLTIMQTSVKLRQGFLFKLLIKFIARVSRK